MAEFAHNNAKNASISHTPFKLYCGFNSKVLFKEDIDFNSKSHSTYKLVKKLRELIEICC